MTRIIAGVAGGRRIAVPPGQGTRPTTDRAREALFSSLVSLWGPLEGARVLDLYAGSGALGLEALSRGAGSATLVEAHPAAVRVCEANAATVGLPGAHVVHSPVEQYLAHGAAPRYDLVLADPPYEQPVDAVLAALVPWLAPEAVVVVERRRRGADLTWPGGLEGVRERKYGEAVLRYAVRTDTDVDAAS